MELTRTADGGAHWMASARHDGVEVRFVGRGPHPTRRAALDAAGGEGLELAWCRQVHSDRALHATPGECGEADALTTDRPGLALAVATADCVPVIVAAAGELAVIHAGWRGIAAAIVPKTVAELPGSESRLAWLGPAIGPCCYEVDDDVAANVVAASSPATRIDRPGARPHLDLHRAVSDQLAACGITSIRRVEACTRCHPESLWSYRREGKGAGRNYSFAWLARQ